LKRTFEVLNIPGAVIESYRYDAFGAPTIYNGSGAQIPGSNYNNRGTRAISKSRCSARRRSAWAFFLSWRWQIRSQRCGWTSEQRRLF